MTQRAILFDEAIFDPEIFDCSPAGLTELDASKKSWGRDWRRQKSPARVVYDRVR
jgi:hypothetical protein